MRPSRDKLTPGEWALLGVQQTAHGFALARAMRPDGEVGRVWSMRRTMVYSALDNLERRALIQRKATVISDTGPRRTMLQATPTGIAALDDWLQQPVERVRDARSLLMLKLLFLAYRGDDPADLLAQQRREFADQARCLAPAAEAAVGFDRTLLLWRLHSTTAVIDFTDALLSDRAAIAGEPRLPLATGDRG